MKTKWREIIIVIVALLLISLVINSFAVWDNTKPADSDAIYGWPASIRANWDAIEDGLFGDINVKISGAVGDGVTDDTTALQAAFDAGAGGMVFLPAGTYIISSALSISSNTTIIGIGNASIIKTTTASTDLFTITGTVDSTSSFSSDASGGQLIVSVDSASGFTAGDAVRIYDDNNTELNIIASISFNDLTMERKLYDDYVDVADSGTVAKLTLVENVTFRNLKFDNTNTDAGGAFDVEYAQNIVIENCYFFETGRNTFDYVENVHVRNNTFYDIAQGGMQLQYSKYCSFANNNVKKCAMPGVVFRAGVDASKIIDNTFTDIALDGIVIVGYGASANCDNNLIRGNILMNIARYGILLDAVSDTSRQRGNQILGNIIKYTTSTAIAITGSDFTLCSNNRIENSIQTAMTLEGSSNCVVSVNQIHTTGSGGLLVAATNGSKHTQYNVISNNHFYNITGEAIEFRDSPNGTNHCRYNLIEGNFINICSSYGLALNAPAGTFVNNKLIDTRGVLISTLTGNENHGTLIGDTITVANVLLHEGEILTYENEIVVSVN